MLLAGVAVCVGVAATNASAADASVVLNEVNCEGTDWVEIVNTSDDPADLSDWLLTDHPLDSTEEDHRMIFPASTEIPALGVLVVERGSSGFPFGISCGSDTILLADATATLVDEIAVPSLTSSVDTWGRYPNGTGEWVQTVSTQGAPNEPSTDPGGPPPDLAAWMFDPATVVEIDLSLPQDSIDGLGEEPTTYHDATFELTTAGGAYEPLAVGARLKGGLGSFRPLSGKAAFKLKFNHSVAGQRFLGLKTLTLNNMVQDSSMVHEVLAYRAFRAAGIAAPRTGYAYVRVNDADYGLYLNVETLDEVSLPRWFESTQHLYEGEHGVDTSVGNANAYEVDEGSESDRTDLEALIAAVNDDSGDWSDGIAGVADLGELTRMWAVEKYIGHWDGYAGGPYQSPNHPSNYYLHSDAAGIFQMLPWGTDQTWGERLPFDARGGLMFDGCLDDASCAAMYREAVIDVRSLVSGLDLDALATTTAATLAPWQEIDPRKEYSLAGIDAGVSATREFLQVRPGDVDAWLLGSVPDPPQDPPDADPPDVSAPETEITKSPRRRVGSRTARFRFDSDTSGAAFECRLDAGGFKPCDSPRTYRKLKRRDTHAFKVRATHAEAGADPTPAAHRWRVKGRGRRGS